MKFFTSDLHMSHIKILQYADRPFRDINEMHKRIIHNWNMRVKENDIVYHIGDFGMRRKVDGIIIKPSCFLEKLNGTIILIKGNHDSRNCIKTICDSMVMRMGNQSIKLVHDPKYADVNYDLNFCGHIHEEPKFSKIITPTVKQSYIINVGCDLWNFMPITFNEIFGGLTKWIKNK